MELEQKQDGTKKILGFAAVMGIGLGLLGLLEPYNGSDLHATGLASFLWLLCMFPGVLKVPLHDKERLALYGSGAWFALLSLGIYLLIMYRLDVYHNEYIGRLISLSIVPAVFFIASLIAFCYVLFHRKQA